MIRLIPVEAGFMTTDTANLCEGATGRMTIPVACWIVEHPRGTILFDTGLHADLVNDTSRLGVLESVFEIDMKHPLDDAIEAAGVDPASIDTIVFSHLHFDHSGGTAAIPNAGIVVQADEWQAAKAQDPETTPGFHAADYDPGHEVKEIRGFHDLFGDGSVVCVPTPGHTAGHQSLRVRLGSGDVLLTGDCCYFRRMLEENLVPPFGFDRDRQREAMATLRGLQADGVRLIFGHDPEQWREIANRPLC